MMMDMIMMIGVIVVSVAIRGAWCLPSATGGFLRTALAGMGVTGLPGIHRTAVAIAGFECCLHASGSTHVIG